MPSKMNLRIYDKDWNKYADDFGYQDYNLNDDNQREEFLSKLKI